MALMKTAMYLQSTKTNLYQKLWIASLKIPKKLIKIMFQNFQKFTHVAFTFRARRVF